MEVCLLLLCWVVVAVGKERNLNSERKKNLLLCPATVTVYICTVTIVSVPIYTFIHPLMWVVLEENCATFDTFCILEALVWMLSLGY